MDATPRANRTHIAFYGTTNSGKSSLINAISKQQISLVSSVAGTTTDPVFKSMEIKGLGACVLIDTAGFDDQSELGNLRVALTQKTTMKADITVLVFDGSNFKEDELPIYDQWLESTKHTAHLLVINKGDLVSEETCKALQTLLVKRYKKKTLIASALQGDGIKEVMAGLVSLDRNDKEASITGNLCQAGDTVILVMPQDTGAPKGRLILPQAQTTRELLDKNCLTISVLTEGLVPALEALKEPPKLIITDSQAFAYVHEHTPKESILTSFSILFARHKGDIEVFAEGAKAIDTLTPTSKVLIAEACTHAPMTEDIGRIKIPNMLRKRVSPDLQIDIVAGSDFKEDLSEYDLIIHCGACMFNRQHVLSRIEKAQQAGTAITNYGIALAHMLGIIDKVQYPTGE